MIAEVLVLAFGLVLAIMRGLPGPVFLPIPDHVQRLHRHLPGDARASSSSSSSASASPGSG